MVALLCLVKVILQLCFLPVGHGVLTLLRPCKREPSTAAAVASSQAAQRRTADGLLPLNVSGSLIGQS